MSSLFIQTPDFLDFKRFHVLIIQPTHPFLLEINLTTSAQNMAKIVCDIIVKLTAAFSITVVIPAQAGNYIVIYIDSLFQGNDK